MLSFADLPARFICVSSVSICG